MIAIRSLIDRVEYYQAKIVNILNQENNMSTKLQGMQFEVPKKNTDTYHFAYVPSSVSGYPKIVIKDEEGNTVQEVLKIRPEGIVRYHIQTELQGKLPVRCDHNGMVTVAH